MPEPTTPSPPQHPPSRPRRAVRVVAGIVVGLLAASGLALLAMRYGPTWFAKRLPTIVESRSGLQLQNLERYATRRAHGTFLPPNAISIGIREDFLQSVLDASLPIEQAFEDGRYRARLDHAVLDLLDGASVVTLTGRGRLATDTTMYADLLVQGTVGFGAVDYEKARLEPRIEITDVRVIGSGPPGLSDIANPVAHYFGNQTARDWNALESPVSLPVQLGGSIHLPATTGDVALPAARLPLAMRVAALTSLQGRMVASVELLPDSAIGRTLGPPAGPWDASPGALRTSRNPFSRGLSAGVDSMRVRALADSALAFAARDTLWRALTLSDRDVAVVVPRTVIADLVGRMTRRYREGIAVDFRKDFSEQVEERIRVKVLGAKVTAGTVKLDIRVRHLKGRIATVGEPDLKLIPPNALAVTLPVRVLDGAGTATFNMAWDPKAYTSVVCRGFETRQTLSGTIAPLDHGLQGHVRFVLAGGEVEGRPRIEREKVRLKFDLTEKSWERVRQVFVEQDEFLKCGAVIEPDKLVGLLKKLGQKGVNIRLPGALPRFTLPVTFTETVEDSLFRLEASMGSPDLIVRPSYLRFGSDALLRLRQVPASRNPDSRAVPAPHESPRAGSTTGPRG